MGKFRNKRELHGERNTKLWAVWSSMKARCDSPKWRKYQNYGGRGISVCEEWYTYTVFAKWARENGYKEGLTLDRINNNGNYEPSNCRFITNTENQRNRNDNLMITAWGETKALSAWIEDSRCVATRSAFEYRTKKGIKPEEAFSYPPQVQRKKR